MLLLLLALDCTGPSIQDKSWPQDNTDDTNDTAEPSGPGDWVDPLRIRMDLGVDDPGMELTDAVMAGDYLVLAGQQQQGKGGVWLFDYASNPLDPQYIGTTLLRNVQQVCWDGEKIWGTDRSALLYRFTIGPDGVSEDRHWELGPNDGGVSCDATHVAAARGSMGAYLWEKSGDTIDEVGFFDEKVTEVLLSGEFLFLLAPDALIKVRTDTLEEVGRLGLVGYCRDLEADFIGLVMACGSDGVMLVDPEEMSLTGSWRGNISARAVSIGAQGIVVAGWTDVVLLDRQGTFIGSEPTHSAAMDSTQDLGGNIYVADWRTPFMLQVDSMAPSPELVLVPDLARDGATIEIRNEGTAPLWINSVSEGELESQRVAPGGYTFWRLPDVLEGTPTIQTDDPDEASVTLDLGSRGGLSVGDAAPQIQEFDTLQQEWTLSDQAGKVVWVGLFEDGCPVCSSEVGATELALKDAFGERDDLVRVWVYTEGASAERPEEWREEAEITGAVLVDSNQSVRSDYFIENGEDAFARNPRHFVIDQEGNIAFIATNLELQGELAVMESLLE